jgi:hypothetical protein
MQLNTLHHHLQETVCINSTVLFFAISDLQATKALPELEMQFQVWWCIQAAICLQSTMMLSAPNTN